MLGRRCHQQGHRGPGQADGQHPALAQPIAYRTPDQQRAQHAEDRSGDQQPGLSQGQPLRPEGRHQERQSVLERAGGDQPGHTDRQHQPSLAAG
jgi:hypothetical protein